MTKKRNRKKRPLLCPGEFVVKIQRPIFPPDGDVLIYDFDRSVTWVEPMSERWAQFFGEDYKVYAIAHIRKTILNIGRRVKDIAW